MFLLAEKHLILQEFISQIPVQMLNLNNDLSYVFSESRGHFAILLQQKDIWNRFSSKGFKISFFNLKASFSNCA